MSGRFWTKEEDQFIQERLQEPNGAIVKQFNLKFDPRTTDSIGNKIRRMRSDPTLPKLAQDLPRPPGPVWYDVDRWLHDLSEEARKRVKKKKPKPVASAKASLVVVLSDTHFGKHTSVYDVETARQRILSIPESLHQKRLPEVDEVVVALVGDIVEGEDIYDRQNGKIELSVFDQTREAAKTLWEMLLVFRKLFGCRVRVETVPGNHGRMSKSANVKSNWDNVVYHILEVVAAVHGDKEIAVCGNHSEFHTFTCKGHAIGAYHKGVKHVGTPAMREKVATWVMSKDIDILLHGHWHEWHVGNWSGRIVVANGSLCGPDDLSEQIAKYDVARQAWFMLEEGRVPYAFSFLEWAAGRKKSPQGG